MCSQCTTSACGYATVILTLKMAAGMFAETMDSLLGNLYKSVAYNILVT